MAQRHFRITSIATIALLAGSMLAGADSQGGDSQDAQDTNVRNGSASEYWSQFKQDSEQAWESTREAFRDGWVEGQLHASLMGNEQLDGLELDVEVDENVATLAGTVQNEAEKQLAEDIAKGIEGIAQVNNQIVVDERLTRQQGEQESRSFAQYLQDVSLTAKIKSRLLADEDIDGLQIDVDTYAGRVTLSGTVKNQQVKQSAERLVSEDEAVASVNNKLEVQS